MPRTLDFAYVSLSRWSLSDKKHPIFNQKRDKNEQNIQKWLKIAIFVHKGEDDLKGLKTEKGCDKICSQNKPRQPKDAKGQRCQFAE